jgi:hypothetical protein
MHGYTSDNIKNAYFTESYRGSPHTLNTDRLYQAKKNDVMSTKTSLLDLSTSPTSSRTANGAFNGPLDLLEEKYLLEWRNSTSQGPRAVIQGDQLKQHS